MGLLVSIDLEIFMQIKCLAGDINAQRLIPIS